MFTNQYQPNNFMGMGMNPSVYQAPPVPKMTQGLTPDEMKSLHKTKGFTLDIPQDEMARSFCTHRTDKGFAVQMGSDGSMTCTICGETFNTVDDNLDAVRETTDQMMNILQTIKMNYLDLSPEAIRTFFQIMPLVARVPDLYEQATKNWRYYNQNGGMNQASDGDPFAILNGIINPAMSVNPYAQAAYGYQPPVNGYYDQNMMNVQQPQYGAYPTQQMPQQPQFNQQMPQTYGNPFVQQPFAPQYNQQQQQGVQQAYVPNSIQAGYQAPNAQQPAPAQNQNVNQNKVVKDSKTLSD